MRLPPYHGGANTRSFRGQPTPEAGAIFRRRSPGRHRATCDVPETGDAGPPKWRPWCSSPKTHHYKNPVESLKPSIARCYGPSMTQGIYVKQDLTTSVLNKNSSNQLPFPPAKEPPKPPQPGGLGATPGRPLARGAQATGGAEPPLRSGWVVGFGWVGWWEVSQSVRSVNRNWVPFQFFNLVSKETSLVLAGHSLIESQAICSVVPDQFKSF